MAARSRPTLKPWLRTLWRDPETLQIGVDPTVGVLVTGLNAVTATWLTGLNGSRSEAQVLADAAAIGLDLGTAGRILSGLRRAGVLLPAAIGPGNLADCGPLLPELIDLTAGRRSAGPGGPALADRSRRHVVIDGANRIGVPLGALLSASGIGRLSFVDNETVRRCDVAVGGLRLEDEGEPRILAAQQAIRRSSTTAQAPEALGRSASAHADLIVLCRPWTAHDPLQTAELPDRSAHLAVAVREGTVVIGPLVLPGRTSCLHCAELHRTDRDPRWPAIAAQLVAGPNRAMHEPTSVLATLAAALAAGQVLEHLDGTRAPQVIEATLELCPPDWELHRRSWPPHADCGCRSTAHDQARSAG
ncbi:MAG: thiamine biosynthesis protein ThiF [Actinomycetota bacterium]|nr:thiamine biosynthesis protein ThiF [Actinomycetota bacterium]